MPEPEFDQQISIKKISFIFLGIFFTLGLSIFVGLNSNSILSFFNNSFASSKLKSPISYYLAFYNSIDFDSNEVIISNPNSTQVSVNVYLEGDKIDGPLQVSAKNNLIRSYNNKKGGPLKIVSEDGSPILVQEKKLLNGYITTVNARNEKDLSSDEILSNYNNAKSKDIDIYVSNPNNNPVTITIKSLEKTLYTSSILANKFVIIQNSDFATFPLEIVAVDSSSKKPANIIVSKLFNSTNVGFNEIGSVSRKSLDLTQHLALSYNDGVDNNCSGDLVGGINISNLIDKKENLTISSYREGVLLKKLNLSLDPKESITKPFNDLASDFLRITSDNEFFASWNCQVRSLSNNISDSFVFEIPFRSQKSINSKDFYSFVDTTGLKEKGGNTLVNIVNSNDKKIKVAIVIGSYSSSMSINPLSILQFDLSTLYNNKKIFTKGGPMVLSATYEDGSGEAGIITSVFESWTYTLDKEDFFRSRISLADIQNI